MQQSDHHVLLVEDDEDIRRSLTEALSDAGIEVTTAEHGAAALQALRHGVAPDLILLDLMMPVMDGWTFRREQKADPSLRGIPVVVMTANNSAAAGAIDAAAVINKPFQLETLLQEMSRILEQRRIEQNAKRFVDIVELMDDAFVLVDQHWYITAVNEAFQRLTQRRRAELIGAQFAEIFSSAHSDSFMTPLRECMTGRTVQRFQYHSQIGKRWFDLHAYPVHGDGIAIFTRDITERRQLEVQLQLTDRMAALGTLAAGVGHEINNPLAYVRSNLSAVRASLDAALSGGLPSEERKELMEALEEALQGVERIRTIVGDLRTFARGSEDDGAVSFDVREALSFAIRMVMPQIRGRAAFDEQHEELPRAAGDATRMGQVFLNLLVNATHAIREKTEGNERISVRTARAADHVVVEVSDTGAGIPPEVLPRIFDPFFTTKPMGVGTGLGLSICQSIVHKANGRIEVSTEPGRGSTFRVVLPVAASS